MFAVLRSVLLALPLLLCLACAIEPDAQRAASSEGARDRSVRNGLPVSAEGLRGVGGILMVDSAGVIRSLCTGTLIGPRVVLTAKHCANTSYALYFTQNAELFRPSGYPYVLVTSRRLHPSADIAVLQLASSIPLPSYFPVGTRPLSKCTTRAQVAGYGEAGSPPYRYAGPVGIKRQGTIRFLDRLPAFSFVGNALRFVAQDDYRSCPPDNSPGMGHITCGGDSGGPIFVSGTIVGVVSAGNSQHCMNVSESYFVNMESYASWVNGFRFGW